MKHRRRAAAVAFLFSMLAATASAEPIRMNFDFDFAGRPLVSGTLLNAAYPSDWFRFGDDDAIRRTGDGVPSLPNFAAGDAFLFSEPIDLFFTRGVSFIQASTVTASDWTLTVFDALGRPLGSASANGFPQSAAVSAVGIMRAQFVRTPTGTTAGFGIDDLVIDANPVPEPSSILLLLTGSAGVIARMRRGGRSSVR